MRLPSPAPEGPKLARCARHAAQQDQGIALHLLTQQEAAQRCHLPLRRRRADGFEPEAGFADAIWSPAVFARASTTPRSQRTSKASRSSACCSKAAASPAFDTSQGRFSSATVVSAQNIWARDIERWTGIETPVRAERHSVLALAGPEPYASSMPVYKDLGSPGMLYCRSYGGTQMLVSEGSAGETLAAPDNEQGEIPVDDVLRVGAQVAERFPSFAEAGLASSWTGVYDVTPDWNPVLGRLPDVPGLVVAYGFPARLQLSRRRRCGKGSLLPTLACRMARAV